MGKNPRLFFLTAGVGFNLVEGMFKEFPDRTLDVGVAEQNLVGVAAGLCNIGFRPICYSYSNFISERSFEQIRNDICLHRYAPILVGTTTGFDNGGLGITHQVLDDIGALKALPHLRIYSPSSSESMPVVFEEVMRCKEASFIRTTKSDFSEGAAVGEVNRFIIKRKGDTLVIAHGKMVQNCLKAAETLPSFSVFAMDRIKPLDEHKLKKLLADHRRVVVVEDNFKSGLYNSICQFMVENAPTEAHLHSLSVREEYRPEIGDAAYLEDLNGLSPQKISRFVQKIVT